MQQILLSSIHQLSFFQSSFSADVKINTRSGIEAVITRTTRNRLYLCWYRGFESHPLRQKQRSQAVLPFVGFSYDIGKFSLSYIIKSASHGDAHSHERQMSAKADHARRSKSVLLGRKWNRKGVRSTLLFFQTGDYDFITD